MSVYPAGKKWAARAYIWCENHYLGVFSTREEALAYVELVHSRYPDRLRRPFGTVTKVRENYYAIRIKDRYVGYCRTVWDGRRRLRAIQLERER